MTDWPPTSWQAKPAAQQPQYPDDSEAARVVSEIAKLPPLVTSWEIHALRDQLAEAARGKRFLLREQLAEAARGGAPATARLAPDGAMGNAFGPAPHQLNGAP